MFKMLSDLIDLIDKKDRDDSDVDIYDNDKDEYNLKNVKIDYKVNYYVNFVKELSEIYSFNMKDVVEALKELGLLDEVKYNKYNKSFYDKNIQKIEDKVLDYIHNK